MAGAPRQPEEDFNATIDRWVPCPSPLYTPFTAAHGRYQAITRQTVVHQALPAMRSISRVWPACRATERLRGKAGRGDVRADI